MKILLLFLIFLISLPVFSLEHYSLPGGSTNQIVDEFAVCKRVTNASSTNYFIPTKTNTEWTTFLSHLPPGVSLLPCIIYSWSFGGWGACNVGGTAAWSYGGYGACTPACGAGTQTRTATCDFSGYSQTRPVTCMGDDGNSYPDASCALVGPKPATSQSCVASDTTLCGVATTTQACAGPACCDTTNWLDQPGKKVTCGGVMRMKEVAGNLTVDCSVVTCGGVPQYNIFVGILHSAHIVTHLGGMACFVKWVTFDQAYPLVITCP
jgi:hypothetical protein